MQYQHPLQAMPHGQSPGGLIRSNSGGMLRSNSASDMSKIATSANQKPMNVGSPMGGLKRSSSHSHFPAPASPSPALPSPSAGMNNSPGLVRSNSMEKIPTGASSPLPMLRKSNSEGDMSSIANRFRNFLTGSGSQKSLNSMCSDTDDQMALETGVCCKPHPNKISTGGEDAYIVKECNGIWLTGVLDGVGSWKSVGVDPAVYSRTFAQRVTDHFVARYKSQHFSARDKKNNKPLLKILDKAFADMQRSGIKGSCTVCLSMLFPNGKLHVLNLGDSGLRLVRNGQVVFKSKEQQTSFNTPRQLGDMSKDVPSRGDYTILDVQRGDMTLIASDGAWDNLWEKDWLKMVHDFNGLDQLASHMCEVAQRHGADKTYESPFAVEAKKIVAGISSNQNLDEFSGGKLDDTTVVIGQVYDIVQ